MGIDVLIEFYPPAPIFLEKHSSYDSNLLKINSYTGFLND